MDITYHDYNINIYEWCSNEQLMKFDQIDIFRVRN